MKLRLCEEDTRPRLYYFVNEITNEEIGETFFMGEIKREIKRVEAYGFTVVNKDQF